MISLAWPLLLLLLPLPWLIGSLRKKENSGEAPLQVPFFETITQLQAPGQHITRDGWQLPSLATVLAVVAWLLLLIAVARPQWIGEPVELPRSGRDLMLAVDISQSMKEQDMVVGGKTDSRIQAVQEVVSGFVMRREGDRLGLLLFASKPYLHVPLTFDRETVGTLLVEAMPGMAGPQTAMGDAIGLAVKRLQERPASGRVLILLTDGQNTAGVIDPLKAAQLAQTAGVRIYTVGIGAEEMLVPGPFGGAFGARVTNPSRDLDETTLQSIAEQTGGRYFRARDPKELATIYQTLDDLEPLAQEAAPFRPIRELYAWPLAGALLCCCLWLLPVATGRRRSNRTPVTATRSTAGTS